MNKKQAVELAKLVISAMEECNECEEPIDDSPNSTLLISDDALKVTTLDDECVIINKDLDLVTHNATGIRLVTINKTNITFSLIKSDEAFHINTDTLRDLQRYFG